MHDTFESKQNAGLRKNNDQTHPILPIFDNFLTKNIMVLLSTTMFALAENSDLYNVTFRGYSSTLNACINYNQFGVFGNE